jgi:hypothetical protein
LNSVLFNEKPKTRLPLLKKIIMKARLSLFFLKVKGYLAKLALSKLIFIALGISSTIWFLIRVIPKPQRATYPCMRAAAPVMSGFIIYLISLSGSVLAFRKAKDHFRKARFIYAVSFFFCCNIMRLSLFDK